MQVAETKNQLPSVLQNWKQPVQRGFILGLGISLLVIALAYINAFASVRLRISDIYFVEQEVSNRIVIVALDDASLNAYGRSPTQWSRQVYADLITDLNAAEARVIAFDILFAEASEDDAQIAESMQAARTSPARTRIIIPIAGVDNVTTSASDMPEVVFTNTLHPVDVISDAADYLAYVNAFPDIDGTLRRQASFVRSSNESGLTLSIATVLAYLRIPASAAEQVITVTDDTLFITDQHPLPIDENGLWRQNFFGMPNTVIPTVSLVDVLEGDVDPTLFADKIVLIGLIDSVGAIDLYRVPTATQGQMMSGVEIHAHAIETILQDKAFQEVDFGLRVLIIALLGIVGAISYAFVRWYFKIIFALGLMFIFFVVASLSFQLTYTILDLFDGALVIGIPLLLSIGLDITSEIARRQKTEFLLESVVALSSQQLDINKIFVAIAHDIQRVLPESSGQITIFNDNAEQSYHFPKNMPQNSHLQALYDTVRTTLKPSLDGQCVALPLVWQQRLIAIMAIDAQQRVTQKQFQLLQEMASDLAPSLENVRLHSEMEHQKNLIEAILYGSPSMNVILDNQLRVIRTNDTFHSFLQGHISTSLKQRNFIDILAELGFEDTPSAEEWFSAPSMFQQQLEFLDKTFTLNASFLYGIDYWVLTLSDITPIAELSALKTQMIRMASHDLKNPISTVLGYSTLLTTRADNLTEKQIRYISSIDRAGNTMLQIVTEILNLENLRSAHVEPEPLDIVAMLRELAIRHEPSFTINSQTFQADLPDSSLMVNGQAGQLSQALSNLLDNAGKYTPENGHISLRLSTTATHSVQIEIQDTGYGIPKPMQARLFEAFYRARTRANSHITGTGLGLSLVKSIIDTHKGRIWVDSDEGSGSTFFVELPLIENGL